MNMTQLAIGLLAALAVGGAAYALIYPYLSGEIRGEKRQRALVTSDRQMLAGRDPAASALARREKVTNSLKEIEAQQNKASKISLERRMLQAGLDWDKKKFTIFSLILAAVLGALLYFVSDNPFVGGAGAFIGGMGLPRWILNFLRKRRMAKFINELPNAMDVIVRGLRSGLPLGDCIRMIASEAAEPVRSEFRQIVETQAMGVSIGDAVAKLYERVPVQEANFFGIVIAVQQKSGGNLSEVLGNLSRVIRDRKKMRGKVSAMSMEAKVSGLIIGSLPIFVGFSVYATTPDYISLLWTTIHGRIFLAIAAAMMATGIFVMKKMISFDI
ncbi:type II secretion system F family protein [Alsobacter sp. KACC 23698]|uniref:Type II secretion system F family protein n=1 Tax=Alsobacter sp. KACC 23698 TaxID=3149229 RepID=A0AAU7JH65_9HYPH